MKNIDDLKECPKCGANWDGGDIYEYFRKAHPEKTDAENKESAECYGWRENNKEHFSHLIGIELSMDNPKYYDGVSYWQCPECGTTWNRFTNKEEAIC